jgi:hypothetical protein
MKILRIISMVIVLFALTFLAGGEAMARTYTSNFPLTENPISEGGNWINGKTVGLDWSDVSTTPGLAIGRESGSSVGVYDDTVALLTGSWGPNQTVQATVHTVNQNDSYFEEVELRLRSSLSAHSSTGYEVLFSCRNTSNAYVQIVRWNGPLGDFTLIDGRGGSSYGIADGDVVKATIVGNVITAYINDVQVLQVTDGTYANGNPGMGFFLQGATGVNGDYGFTSFTASDGGVDPHISLGLTLNRHTVSAGDPVQVDISVANPGAAAFQDVFFVLLVPPAVSTSLGCPAGDAVVFLANAFASFVVRCANTAPPQTFPPLFSNVSIPGGFPQVTIPSFFSLSWPAGIPRSLHGGHLHDSTPGFCGRDRRTHRHQRVRRRQLHGVAVIARPGPSL